MPDFASDPEFDDPVTWTRHAIDCSLDTLINQKVEREKRSAERAKLLAGARQILAKRTAAPGPNKPKPPAPALTADARAPSKMPTKPRSDKPRGDGHTFTEDEITQRMLIMQAVLDTRPRIIKMLKRLHIMRSDFGCGKQINEMAALRAIAKANLKRTYHMEDSAGAS